MGGGQVGRVGRSSACAHPVKPGAPGGLVKHGCTLSSRGGLHWALMAPTRANPFSWLEEGWPGRSLFPSLLSPCLPPF